jgi:hypothetical protein
MDLTGDGFPDLVLTQSCADPSVSSAQWLVYPGAASGFASSPTAFALPKLDQPISVPWGEAQTCANGSGSGSNGQVWTTTDLTGDGFPDLVVTHSCTDVTVGVAHWELYPGARSGFAASPTSFALPALPGTLWAYSCPGSCSGGSGQTWTTMDLTGAGHPDLVLTHSPTDLTVGSSDWQVFAASCTSH